MLPDPLHLFVRAIVIRVSDVVPSRIPPGETLVGLEQGIEHVFSTVFRRGREEAREDVDWTESPMLKQYERRRDCSGVGMDERDVRVFPNVVLQARRVSE